MKTNTAHTTPTTQIKETAFAFGENWRNYITKYFSNEALESSTKRLREFLGVETLEGKTFIDLGSGSGIHSLSALTLGATKVVSVDVDTEAVKCAEDLKKNSKFKDRWEIYHGSLLDKDFLGSLGQFDIVYSWGVAHHTGDMWKALDNISHSVKQNGTLFVAIYNYVEGKRGSKMWFAIKKFYNRAPTILKKIMEWVYIGSSFVLLLLKLNNPFRILREYKNKRGMAWSVDLVDWLGGYPYEYASVKEIFDFYKQRGFELQNIKTTNYIGCNQFLFIKNK